jgi:hypothetical protein
MPGYWNAHSDRDFEDPNHEPLPEYGEWVECWQCFGNGRIAGCFEDTCVCTGDPEDPDYCCNPSKCAVCRGKGGWQQEES